MQLHDLWFRLSVLWCLILAAAFIGLAVIARAV